MRNRPGKNYYNSLVIIDAKFRDQNDALIAPTTVTFETYDPDGVDATYTAGTDDEIVNSATGVYEARITPNKAGRWSYRWSGTYEGLTIREEGTFVVQESQWYDGSRRSYTD